MRPLLLILLAVAVQAEDKPVLSQAGATATQSRASAAPGGERSASGAAVAFGDKAAPGAVAIGNPAFKPAPPAALTAAPQEAPAVAPPGPKTYAAKEEGPQWDRDGTIKSGALGMAGALVGFLLGGPIGACVGFLGAFFIGAMLWKAGKL
ncbi:hypothetical protein EPO15_01595 [bacterium]|nr:MAG: hypothetical protein EPO15_01595 [bacterium]